MKATLFSVFFLANMTALASSYEKSELIVSNFVRNNNDKGGHNFPLSLVKEIIKRYWAPSTQEWLRAKIQAQPPIPIPQCLVEASDVDDVDYKLMFSYTNKVFSAGASANTDNLLLRASFIHMLRQAACEGSLEVYRARHGVAREAYWKSMGCALKLWNKWEMWLDPSNQKGDAVFSMVSLSECDWYQARRKKIHQQVVSWAKTGNWDSDKIAKAVSLMCVVTAEEFCAEILNDLL